MHLLMRLPFFLFVLLTLFFKLSADKPEAWFVAFLPMGEYRDVNFLFRQEYRLALGEYKLISCRNSFQAVKALTENINTEVHYTLIFGRGRHVTPFDLSTRYEFELNPHFNINDHLEFRQRNRYEIIRRNADPRYLQNYRQRLQFVLAVNYKCLRSISIHNEVFYNITDNRVDQDRFVPVELAFRLGEKHTITTYVMIRWLKPATTWDPQYIWGLTYIW